MVLLDFSFSTCRQPRTGLEVTDHCWKLCTRGASPILSSLSNAQPPLTYGEIKAVQHFVGNCTNLWTGRLPSHCQEGPPPAKPSHASVSPRFAIFQLMDVKKKKTTQLLTIRYYNGTFFGNMCFSHPTTVILTFRGGGKTHPIPTSLPLKQTNKAFSSSEFRFLLELIQQPERIARSQGPASFNTPPSF